MLLMKLICFHFYHRSLKEAFLYQLLNSVQKSDLQLRNDLLVITCLIAENTNSLLIVSTRQI